MAGPSAADPRTACRADLADDASCGRFLRSALKADQGDRYVGDMQTLSREREHDWWPHYRLAEHALRTRRDRHAATLLDEAARRAESSGEIHGIGRTGYLRSVIAGRAGDSDRQQALLHQAAALPFEPTGPGRRFSAILDYRLASHYRKQGRFARELAHLERSAASLRAVGEDASLRPTLYALGQSQRRMGRLADAEHTWRELLRRAREEGSIPHQAEALQGLGLLQIDQASDAEAVGSFADAGRLADEAGESELSAHASILQSHAYRRMGRHAEAQAALERVPRTVAGGTLESRVNHLLAWGDLERSRKALATAQRHYEAGLQLARSHQLHDLEWELLANLAALQLDAGAFAAAVETANQARKVVESLRDQVTALPERERFLALRSTLFLTLASALAAENPGDLAPAFEALEQIHGRTLREWLLSRQVDGWNPHAEMSRVQAELEPGDLLLEYALGSERSALLAVTREEAHFLTLPAGREIERAVRDYLAVIERPLRSLDARWDASGDFRRLGDSGHTLFNLLIAPALAVRPAANRLLIVPDGELHRLPFEALLAAPVDSGSRPTFLAERFNTVYRTSGSAVVRQAPAVLPPRRIGLLTAASASPSLRLPALEHAAAEHAAIAEAHGASQLTEYRGAAATPAALASLLDAKLDVLHVIAHTRLRRADSPQLVLHGGSTVDLNTLAAGHAPALAILAACSSGEGEVVGGEGVLGLVRALTLAGTSETVASLWPVDDRSSSELMRDVHHHLAAGAPTETALATARREAIEGGDWHPFYWAPFVLYQG